MRLTLVEAMQTDRDSAATVRTPVSVERALGLEVIAERRDGRSRLPVVVNAVPQHPLSNTLEDLTHRRDFRFDCVNRQLHAR